jgi:hypothetical protein
MADTLQENDEFFADALGQLCLVVSTTENILRNFIQAVIMHKDEKIAEKITSDMHFVPLCKLLIKLYNYRVTHRKQQEQFRKLIVSILRAYEKRDEYVHSEWKFLTPIEGKKTKRFITTDAKVTDVYKLVTEFHVFNERLHLALHQFTLAHNPTEKQKEILQMMALYLQLKEQHEKGQQTKTETKS